MIFNNGSNNVFCFGLRVMGAELEGGVQTPPPSRAKEMQRPSGARVKKPSLSQK